MTTKTSSIVLIKTIVINPLAHDIAVWTFVQDAEFLPARDQSLLTCRLPFTDRPLVVSVA